MCSATFFPSAAAAAAAAAVNQAICQSFTHSLTMPNSSYT